MKSWVMDQIVSFSMTFSDSNPGFKVTVFFEGEYLKDGESQGQSFYRTLTENHNQSVE